MDTQEKTLAEQFRSLQIAAHRYLRGQYRKAAEETSKESRKEIADKIFSCLSEEEQKNMRSYLERVAGALKSETKETGDGGYDFPFDGDFMDFVRLPGFCRYMGGFGHPGRRSGIYGHGCERMHGFI
ncbi:MAG: hypothetical protein LBK05_02695 [Treponema sp.]|jgi:hypothetical protein|nr:hypothetical protein [Treponema sp.]